LLVKNKKPASAYKKVKELIAPLKNIRVWRFGLYYVPLVAAGILAVLFSFPLGVIRDLLAVRQTGGQKDHVLGAA